MTADIFTNQMHFLMPHKQYQSMVVVVLAAVTAATTFDSCLTEHFFRSHSRLDQVPQVELCGNKSFHRLDGFLLNSLTSSVRLVKANQSIEGKTK